MAKNSGGQRKVVVVYDAMQLAGALKGHLPFVVFVHLMSALNHMKNGGQIKVSTLAQSAKASRTSVYSALKQLTDAKIVIGVFRKAKFMFKMPKSLMLMPKIAKRAPVDVSDVESA